MMETYKTQATNLKSPWAPQIIEKMSSQSSFLEDREENTDSLVLRETLGRERTRDEAHSSEVTTKNFGLSLNQQEKRDATASSSLKEAREGEMTRTQRPEGEKIRQGAWQQLFLQGWKRLFNPPPQQQEESVMKHQEAYSGDAAKKHEEVLELSQHQLECYSQPPARDLRQPDGVEGRQADFGRDMPVTTQQEIYAGEILDKERNNSGLQPHHDAEEARETPKTLRELMDHSDKSARDQDFPPIMKCGTEIRQETSRGQEHQQYWSLSEWLSEIEGTKTVRERKESSKDFADLSRGTESWECPPLMKYGSEAPILKTFYHRDERLLEKEQVKLEQETDHNRSHLRKEGTNQRRIYSSNSAGDWRKKAQALRRKMKLEQGAPIIIDPCREESFHFERAKDRHRWSKNRSIISLKDLKIMPIIPQLTHEILAERNGGVMRQEAPKQIELKCKEFHEAEGKVWRQEVQEENSQGPRRVLRRRERGRQHFDRFSQLWSGKFKHFDRTKECQRVFGKDGVGTSKRKGEKAFMCKMIKQKIRNRAYEWQESLLRNLYVASMSLRLPFFFTASRQKK